MYESIFFTVGKKTIELYGKEFTLGELTTQVLNIPVADFKIMQELLEQALSEIRQYEKAKDIAFWAKANDSFTELDVTLCKYPVFQYLKNGETILEETSVLLSDLMTTGDYDFTLSEEDRTVQELIDAYEDYLCNPNDYGGENVFEFTNLSTGEKMISRTPQPPIPQSPPPKTRNLLIIPGDLALKWAVYTRLTAAYTYIVEDIQSFNNTIYVFIDQFLSKLAKLNPSNYAAALYNFLNHSSVDKLVATPWRGTGNYTGADAVMQCKSSAEGKQKLADWLFYAEAMALPEFDACTKAYHNWFHEIIHSMDAPWTNGYIEGCNNKTKVLKRVSYGMPNFNNFRKRILFCNS